MPLLLLRMREKVGRADSAAVWNGGSDLKHTEAIPVNLGEVLKRFASLESARQSRRGRDRNLSRIKGLSTFNKIG